MLFVISQFIKFMQAMEMVFRDSPVFFFELEKVKRAIIGSFPRNMESVFYAML